MIDRSQIPETRIPSKLPEINYTSKELDNGLVVYSALDAEELVRITLYHDCGSLYESKQGLASALAKLILSGSTKYSAYEIEETLDFYGAYTDIDCTYSHISVTVFCVKEYVNPILTFLEEVLSDIAIPEKEFRLYIDKSIENLKVNEQKTSFLARRLFNENMYGSRHPYGQSMNANDYAALTREDIQAYYENHFKIGLNQVQVNTPLNEDALLLLSRFPRGTTKSRADASLISEGGKHMEHHFQDAVQASLYLGMPCLTRQDPDYPAWSLLITMFGGYFGSRLMKNIREDKGYTYGISAGTHHLPDRSFLAIRSDVKNEAKQDCVDEIFKEIARLKTTAITDEELLTVKNYMLGSLQRSFDGSLALGDRYRIVLDHHLPLDYYQTYSQKILKLTKEDVYQIANKYLDTNKLHVVTVGHFEK
ncbi:MAG: M16 family metallopeptidase [Bacteroidia bacterium]